MLIKPYEMSLWQTQTIVGENTHDIVDKKLFVIGSDTMDYPGRAQDPTFTANINGQISLTFKMPYRYIDNITGEEVENVFTKYITNESRVKLKYDGEWYDFIVKNIQENSQNYYFTYQLESQYVNELSRTGFELVFDTDLNNNIGTVQELGAAVLADTDWTVDTAHSDNIYQVEEETVIPYKLSGTVNAHKLVINADGTITDTPDENVSDGYIYAFYSCCASKADRLQFIWTNGAAPILDDLYNISNGNQYYILGATYSDNTDKNGVHTPDGFSYVDSSNPEASDYCPYADRLLRGRRLVFTQASHFNKNLGQTLKHYSNGPLRSEIITTAQDKSSTVEPVRSNFNTNQIWVGLTSNNYFKNDKISDYTITDSSISVTSTQSAYGLGIPYSCEGGKTYSFSFTNVNQSAIFQIGYYTHDGVYLDREYIGNVASEFSFTTPAKCGWFTLIIYSQTLNVAGVVEGLDLSTLWYGWTEVDTVAPVLIQEIVSPCENFTNTTGWQGSRNDSTAGYATQYDLKLRADTIPSLLSRMTDTGAGQHGPYPIYEGLQQQEYTPLFVIEPPDQSRGTPILVNNGFLASKNVIKEFVEGEKFSCLIHCVDASNVTTTLGFESFSLALYDTQEVQGRYQLSDSDKYIQFHAPNDTTTSFSTMTINGVDYIYAEGTVIKPLTIKEYNSPETHPRLILSCNDISDPIYIRSFEVFRSVYDANGNLITPHTQTAETSFNYHDVYIHSSDEDNPVDEIEKSDSLPDDSYPILVPNCGKRKTISAKQSNRFNILQSICETFECWMKLEIGHDALGNVTSKAVSFHNYIGQDNPIDFVYGIDVNSIQRTADSKQIVTKLIVQANNNEYAPSGFCSIQRASANPTGEETIYNFDYYLRQGLLDDTEFYKDLYKIDPDHPEYLGYFYKLKNFNNQLQDIADKLSNVIVPWNAAASAVDVASTGISKANDQLDTVAYSIWKASDYSWDYIRHINPNTIEHPWPRTPTSINDFTSDQQLYAKIFGYTYEDIGLDVSIIIPQDVSLYKYVVSALELETQLEELNAQYAQAKTEFDAYDALKSSLETQREALVAQKAALNTAFFNRYASFIQEGTWNNNDYTDDNLYFYDAQSVSAESAIPKITYNISVIDVSGIDEFENYRFKVGDRTHIQDTEFFGYTTQTYRDQTYKVPVRQAISVTELAWHLDDPSKNTIKVQTYKSPFEDLFHRITATVQSVNYARDGYERAVELVDGDESVKMEFLEQALTDASAVLRNAANQSVTWDSRGIMVVDGSNTSQQVRIVSGGILLTNDGGETWDVGITSDGISASRITSGEINTGVVSIMNGTEAYFRWDAQGITAYDYDSSLSSDDVLNGLDTAKGVRFDKFGVYGYAGVDGSNWYPTSVVEWGNGGQADFHDSNTIREHSTFELTREGLVLKPGPGTYSHGVTKGGTAQSPTYTPGEISPISHNHSVYIGRVDDLIYNQHDIDANNNYIPYYDQYAVNPEPEFVKVLSIEQSGHEELAIYDNGTLVAYNVVLKGNITATSGTFTGDIYATGGTIGGWTIDSTDGLIDSTDTIGLVPGGTTIGNISDVVFYADESFKVTSDGALYATSGNIGGWNLSQYKLYSGSGSTYVALNTSTSGDNANYSIWAGNATASSAPFSVQNDGTLTAKSGTIGGWTIEQNILKAGSGSNEVGLYTYGTGKQIRIYAGNSNGTIAPFRVYSNGELYATSATITGAVNATSGSFGKSNEQPLSLASVSSNGEMVTALQTSGATYAGSAGYGPTKNALVHLGGDGFSYYCLNSDNMEWTTSIRPDIIYTSVQKTSSNYAGIMIQGDRIQFGYGSDYGRSGSFSSARATITNGTSYTYLTGFRHSSIMPVSGGYIGDGNNRWDYIYLVHQPDVNSDVRIKKNIEVVSQNYDTFFDKLSPRSYTLIKDDKQTHIGFIAQDVRDALLTSNLTPKDFAGYNDSGDMLSLAYGEFTALNTWQIQRLKSRITELEARLAQLESRT